MGGNHHSQPRRFRVDPAEPPEEGRLPFRVVIERKRKRKQPRFRVGPEDPSRQAALPFRVTIQRRTRTRLSPSATARRARLRHWGANVSSALAAPRRAVRQWRRRHTPVTLGERRQARAWALRLALAGMVLVAAVAGLAFSPLLRHPDTVHSASAATASGNEAGELQHLKAAARRPDPAYPSLQLHAPGAGAGPPAVRAPAAFLFDPDRGIILYQKNADQPRPLASTTKVMTLLLATRYNLDQTVTIGPDAAALVNGDNSYMGVSAGERLTLRELLYGLVVASGNDAAVAIADQIGGTEAAFVTMMNHEAWLLGLTETHFVSPDGLDDGNRASAHDLAVLSALALQVPGVEQITSTRHLKIAQTATHKSFELWSGNDLLAGGAAPYPGAIGVKTGYTVEAGYTMAFAARIQGHLFVGAVLGDPSPQARAADARALLDWAAAQG